MDILGVPSGRDASGSTRTLHARGWARVTRLSLPGRTVIRTEFLGPDAERRMRRELAMLERLRGLPGVAQLPDEPSEGGRNRGAGPLRIGYGLTALIRVPQLMSGARVCPQVGSAW
jgi:hypothetical protein